MTTSLDIEDRNVPTKYGFGFSFSYEGFTAFLQCRECKVVEVIPQPFKDGFAVKVQVTGPRPCIAGKPVAVHAVREGADYPYVRIDWDEFLRS